jgi:hypothetical protein
MGEVPPYEVAAPTRPRSPRLRGDVVLREDIDGAIDAMLADMLLHAGNCVRVFGDVHVAIDACERLEPVLRRLMYDPVYRQFPWQRTRLYLVRERDVPEGQRAWDLARDLVVEPSGMPQDQAYPLEAWLPDGPARYAAVLREHLGWRPKGHDRLDLVVLALSPAADVGLVTGSGMCQDLCVERMTDGVREVGLADKLVNASRLVAVYAGEAGGAVRRIEDNLHKPDEQRDPLGALALAPAGGELRWYMDFTQCPST